MIATDTTLRPIMSHMTHEAPKPTMIFCSQPTRFIFPLAFRPGAGRAHSSGPGSGPPRASPERVASMTRHALASTVVA